MINIFNFIKNIFNTEISYTFIFKCPKCEEVLHSKTYNANQNEYALSFEEYYFKIEAYKKLDEHIENQKKNNFLQETSYRNYIVKNCTTLYAPIPHPTKPRLE